jgi:hypothetical protein
MRVMRVLRPRCLAAASLLSSLALGGCDKGKNLGEAVAPKAITAESVVDAPAAAAPRTCVPVGPRADPLVVDLRAEDRVQFETAMQGGIAVVRYDCAGLELLRDCSAGGDYGFKGVTRKERLVQLTTKDEIAANLPVTGGALAVEFGAQLARGASLDLAMVMIGRRSSSRATVARGELRGDECDGATHFIRGATIGAVAMRQGTAGQASTAAKVFTASVGAGSSADRATTNVDGSLEACATATASSLAPPEQCAALIRLELKGIAEGAAGAAADPAEAVAVLHCPEGFAASGDVCVPEAAASAQTRTCEPRDADGCSAACEAGDAPSCAYLGILLDEQGPSARALAAHERACSGGVAAGCHNVAFTLFSGAADVPKDPARARAVWTANCDAGFVESCSGLGLMFEQGVGTAQDLPRAAALYEVACTAGDMTFGCPFFALMLGQGRGVAVDLPRAQALAAKACERGSSNGCAIAKQLGRGGR